NISEASVSTCTCDQGEFESNRSASLRDISIQDESFRCPDATIASSNEVTMMASEEIRNRSFIVCSVFQLTVVHHVRNFEAAVHLNNFAQLNIDTDFTAAGVDEWRAIQRAWKDEFGAHSILNRRAIIRERNSLAIFALKVAGGLQHVGVGAGNLLHGGREPFLVRAIDKQRDHHIIRKVSIDKGPQLGDFLFSQLRPLQFDHANEGRADRTS